MTSQYLYYCHSQSGIVVSFNNALYHSMMTYLQREKQKENWAFMLTLLQREAEEAIGALDVGDIPQTYQAARQGPLKFHLNSGDMVIQGILDIQKQIAEEFRASPEVAELTAHGLTCLSSKMVWTYQTPLYDLEIHARHNALLLRVINLAENKIKICQQASEQIAPQFKNLLAAIGQGIDAFAHGGMERCPLSAICTPIVLRGHRGQVPRPWT